MVETLSCWAAERGYEVAWGPFDVVRSVCAELRDRRTSGELDDGLFCAELAAVASGGEGRDGGTVVIVAKGRPAFRVDFDLGDRVLSTLMPPTYFRYRATFEEVRQDLAANALPGERVELLSAPLKAIAARLGLVRYGRNNLAYAKGMGSFLQLCGFVTDAQLPATSSSAAHAPTLLPECDGCTACQNACPTGAIRGERVLLHAERCLTFANENDGDWPDWVPTRGHNSLIGCLLCQRVCPANPRLTVVDSGVRFSADETRALLEGDGDADQRTETGIRCALSFLGQPAAEPVLGRNLRALVDRRANPARPG